jgi:TPR repeat protein
MRQYLLRALMTSMLALGFSACDYNPGPNWADTLQRSRPLAEQKLTEGDNLDEATARHNREIVGAWWTLGMLYSHGYGVKQDYAEAIKWYRLAAEAGDRLAQKDLGEMYYNGQGVPQDYLRAYMWSPPLGGSRGVHSREIVAAKMTPEQIIEGEAMVQKCQASNFKQCD